MRHAGADRTLPNAREVGKVLGYLGSPKTVTQVSAEAYMEAGMVAKAVRILQYRHQIIEVDCDPETYMRVGA